MDSISRPELRYGDDRPSSEWNDVDDFMPLGSGIPDLINMFHDQFLGSTLEDVAGMERMGKVQELKRNYNPLSALSFIALVQASWEYLLIEPSVGLINGGLAGYFWTCIWGVIGGFIIVLSFAEMASIAPVAGGQYHWVSEFAPARYQKFLSHQMGWMTILAWQAGNTTGSAFVATMIMSLIGVKDATYEFPAWHEFLLTVAVAILLLALNVLATAQIPAIQNALLILHVAMFWFVIILLWILSPRTSATAVFTSFSNTGNWKTMGLSLMLGQSAAAYSFTAVDAGVHLSEETRDAAITVPRAMVNAYLLNTVMGLAALITFLFCLTDLPAALGDQSGYPLVWVLRQTTSDSVLIFIFAMMIVIVFAGLLSYNIATSRITWAFARDKGVPGYKWVSKVSPAYDVPVNSAYVTLAITIILSLVSLGSETAFSAIISLNLVALMTGYFVSSACLLYRKLCKPETIPKHRYDLGLKGGIAVNVATCLYSFYQWFWAMWPSESHVSASNFNWAIVMYFVVVFIALLDYYWRGRRDFDGPAKLVKTFKQG